MWSVGDYLADTDIIDILVYNSSVNLILRFVCKYNNSSNLRFYFVTCTGRSSTAISLRRSAQDATLLKMRNREKL